MKTNNSGFTLVELIVTVAIIGILAGLVYPSLSEYGKTAECSDGMDSLLAQSGFMEEFYDIDDTYVGATLITATSPKGYYEILISAQTAFLYTLTATPVDTTQKTLTLDSLGQQTESTGSGVSCW